MAIIDQQQVLIHHPDKQENKEDATFKCIQIGTMICVLILLNFFVAYEILGDPKKRKSYDSIDPTFSDVVPSVSTNSKENFYDIFEPVFRDNARFDIIEI